jgi:uncharacterized protein DUF262
MSAVDEGSVSAETEDLSAQERDEAEEAVSSAYQVVYAGQDFDVEGLVRRLDRGDILIPQFGHNYDQVDTAGFQRSFVWQKPQMDRFVESMLLGYPIPSILLVRQSDRRYLVLDGQQRLRTLQYFYSGVYRDRTFSLSNVSEPFRNLTYKTLSADQRRTLDNTYIQATIVDTDGSEDSQEAIYQIFERLNSGGTQLTPHEIRVALYAGPLIDYLHSLNHDNSWRNVYGPISPRLRDQEMVLRILALYLDELKYFRPLKQFLNRFASEQRTAADPRLEEAGRLFKLAASKLDGGPGSEALRRRSRILNVAQTDAVFVGLMTELNRRDLSETQVTEAVHAIRTDETIEPYVATATSNEESVAARLHIAREHFAAV